MWGGTILNVKNKITVLIHARHSGWIFAHLDDTFIQETCTYYSCIVSKLLFEIRHSALQLLAEGAAIMICRYYANYGR